MQQSHREERRKHGGWRLSRGGWVGVFGAVKGSGQGTRSACVGRDKSNDVVGDLGIIRSDVGVKRSVQQAHNNENIILNHGQSHNALKS
ncbi:hypothetical protein P8452_33493 [Trifolium repens]|jgi:hypothetical protein|nr:hypothetical protein P8452_33493 [Trifolium repens]